MKDENTTSLVGPPSSLRSLARTLQKKNIAYQVERIVFKNHNPAWKGINGIGLRVTIEGYQKLYV